jgi:hypothetical protein
MREKLEAISPWLSIVNAAATALMIAFLMLYVGLPSTVAVHAKSIQMIESVSVLNASRLSLLELGGTLVAKDHIATDEVRQKATDARLLELEKQGRSTAENLATIIERLSNLQKLIERQGK